MTPYGSSSRSGLSHSSVRRKVLSATTQPTAERRPGDLCGRSTAPQHAVALGKLIMPDQPRERRLVRGVEAHAEDPGQETDDIQDLQLLHGPEPTKGSGTGAERGH